MKSKHTLLIVALAGFFLAVAAQAQFGPRTSTMSFQFEADVTYSQLPYKGDYEVQLVRLPEDKGFELRFVRDKKTALSFPAHLKTGFKEVKGVVYYPLYSQTAGGCTVVAYNLKQKKELWRTKLKGLEDDVRPVTNNMVIIDADEESVWVDGHQTNGEYHEKLENVNGTTIVHKPRRFKEWGQAAP